MTNRRRLVLVTVLAVVALVVALPRMGLAQGSTAPAGDVVGVGTFIHVVENLDRTMAFYGALLGVEPNGGARARTYAPNDPVATMYNTPGSKFRGATYRVPNSSLSLEFIDWENNTAPHVDARLHDHGAVVIILQIRDLDAALAAVAANGGSTLTREPVRFSSERFSSRRLIIVRDPDGYFIELIAPDSSPAAEEPGNVLSGAFRYTTTDANKTANFFKEAFAFDVTEAGDFSVDPVLGEMMGLGVLNQRFARSTVPGSALSVQFAEFRGTDGRGVSQGLPRAGTAMLRLFVRDLDTSLAKAKAAGATVAPGNDPPVTLAPGRRMAVVIEPNGLLLQLAETR